MRNLIKITILLTDFISQIVFNTKYLHRIINKKDILMKKFIKIINYKITKKILEFYGKNSSQFDLKRDEFEGEFCLACCICSNIREISREMSVGRISAGRIEILNKIVE